MIRVLVVEDSLVVQTLLTHILESDPAVTVVGTASNGLEALKFLETETPDVITMDIHMPKMNGFEATRRIMETKPVPIVIISASWNPEEVEKTFRSLSSGALAVMEKPIGIAHPNFEHMARKIVQTVKAMSEVKVIRRLPQYRSNGFITNEYNARFDNRPGPIHGRPADVKCVAIGASTGGPPALQTILSGLSKDYPFPILIVQHITAGFLQGMVDWLLNCTDHKIRIATRGELLLPGHVYFAPDGCHMGVGSGSVIALSADEPENGLRPSVSYLFRSVANTFGPNAIGVLLTGMGRDGAMELKLMKDKGAVTIAQDKESSVVHGMPGAAISLGAANYVFPVEKIAANLEKLAGRI